ncbi:MAG: pilin [Patescibacteria group bacterium]|nr:pilin [Patescibacteria group bacterium]
MTEVTGGAGGNTSRIKAPAECAKIKADFKIDIRTGDAGTQPQEDCQFLKGDVIAMRAMGTDECRFAPNGAKNLCPATMCSRGAGGAPETDGCYLYNPSEFGIVAMLSVVYNITNWIFFILIILSALMIIWGGLQYILAAGDPAKAGKGKTILTLSIIGIAIALLAKVVPSVLKFFLGV